MISIQELAGRLEKKAGELMGGLSATWHYPEKLPADRLNVKLNPSWPTMQDKHDGPKDENGHYWFYAEFEFPETLQGMDLRGKTAKVFLRGILPFTLWIDGEEIFRETHAWMATGPIAEPFPMAIEPGRKYRLVMRIEPIHVGMTGGLWHQIVPEPCIDAARELNAAGAQLRCAEALARDAADRRAVERAAAQVDVAAVEANKWDKALASIARMERALKPFSSRAREITLHVLGHTHIDMDWQWTWNDTVHCIRRDFKAVTDMMDDYPDLTFSCSQIPLYDVCRQMDPPVFAKVKKRIAEGRWENAAGTWVEGDLNMADGESVARHMLYASDWAQKHLGSKARVLWEPDTFGHPGNMPQLARLGEFDSYFHLRCNPGGEEGMWPARRWTGIDGTSITAFTSWYADTLAPNQVMRDVLYCLRSGRKIAFHMWGVGDHGGALSRFQLRELSLYCDKPVMPRFVFSTIGRVLKDISKEKNLLPANTGDTNTLFEGCYTTHAGIKADNRRCEGALLAAESLVAMAHAAGADIDRNAVLRDAWTPVLFNQFHDIFDGCSIPAAYADAHARSEKSRKTAERVAKEAATLLVDVSAKGRMLTLVNPLGFDRTEPVRVALPPGAKCLMDADGTMVPIQKCGMAFVFIAKGVPAFSTKTYRVLTKLPKGSASPEVKVTPSQYGFAFDLAAPGSSGLNYYDVETEHSIIRICRQNGAIGSYFDKRLQRELVNYGVPRPLSHVPSARLDLALNVFQVVDEAPNDAMAAWLMNHVRREEYMLDGAEVTLLETGPVFAAFSVKHKFRASAIEEQILIYRDFDRVDFEATIDWREKGGPEAGVPQLKVAFAASMRAARLRTEGPFTVTERAADGQEVPTQKWADLSGDEFGFSVCNDSKYGCDAMGSRLRLTLLRNSYTPDIDSDNGMHTVRFSFRPHAAGEGSESLVREGMAFNRPCMALSTKEAAGSRKQADETPFLRIEGSDSVVCTALRRAEHSDGLLVRLFETSGKACRVRVSLGKGKRRIKSVQEVNFLENATGRAPKVTDGKVAASFRGFEVKTLLVRF